MVVAAQLVYTIDDQRYLRRNVVTSAQPQQPEPLRRHHHHHQHEPQPAPEDDHAPQPSEDPVAHDSSSPLPTSPTEKDGAAVVSNAPTTQLPDQPIPSLDPNAHHQPIPTVSVSIVASSDDAAAISDDELDEEDDEQPQNRGVNPMDDFDPEDLKNPRAPELDYCPLCFNIPNRAKLLTCCGNRIICSICARNWLQKHKTCPFCRTRIRASKRATGLEDAVAQQTLINELDVICPYEDAGCDWIGLRKNVKQHLVEDCVVAFDRETGERAAGTLPIAEFALDVVWEQPKEEDWGTVLNSLGMAPVRSTVTHTGRSHTSDQSFAAHRNVSQNSYRPLRHFASHNSVIDPSFALSSFSQTFLNRTPSPSHRSVRPVADRSADDDAASSDSSDAESNTLHPSDYVVETNRRPSDSAIRSRSTPPVAPGWRRSPSTGAIGTSSSASAAIAIPQRPPSSLRMSTSPPPTSPLGHSTGSSLFFSSSPTSSSRTRSWRGQASTSPPSQDSGGENALDRFFKKILKR